MAEDVRKGDGADEERLHERLSELFASARHLEGRELDAFLLARCGDDADLRARLERLLAAARDAPSTRALRVGVEAGGRRLLDAELRAGRARPGDVLAGRYELRSLLGEGGMGEVFEAHDRELGIEVALKTLRAQTPGGDALRALKREALMARKVSHPNVCRLHDLGRDGENGVLFLTMELLRGETLSGRLARRGPLSVDAARPIARGIARGLDAVHDMGVVHRDLKGANVLLAIGPGEERAVLTDFGLALATVEGVERDGFVRGTLATMAPEQLRGDSVGPAADVYAFGVVLFEMVTGRVPFEGDDALQTAERKLDEDAPAARSLCPTLPSEWDDVIRLCLARDPGQRFRRAGQAWAALAGEAPSTVIAPAWRGSLPAETDSFVGRSSEVERIAKALEGGTRLLTLLGPAGTGKTRLAIHAAHEVRQRWPGGAWFCDMAEARSVEGIARAVATVLDVPLAGEDPIDRLGHAIAGRGPALFVIDNFEQVVPHARATLGRWRERAGEAAFVVTSRERLNLPGEDVLAVGPLGEAEGLELFLERARMHRPTTSSARDVDAVRGIVSRLDALPLAIELAAARLRILTVDQVAERLSDRFGLLAASRPSGRHRTLRAAFDVSWELLAPWEQAAFAQCAVFEAGFTLEAAEAVLDLSAWPEAATVLDVVQSLVDKSLLQVGVADGEPRFTMLASLHEYARERLGTWASQAEQRHSLYFAGFGEDEAMESLERQGGAERRRRLARESDNLLVACRRAVARQDGDVAGAALIAAAAVLTLRGPRDAMVSLAEEVLAHASPSARMRGWLHMRTGRACAEGGRMQEAREHDESALAIASEIGDQCLEGVALVDLGALDREQGRMDEALAHFERAHAIAIALPQRRLESVAQVNLGMVHVRQGRMKEARACFERGLAIAREVGSQRVEGIALASLGVLHDSQGHRDEARRHHEDALAMHREQGSRRPEAVTLGNLGFALAQQRRWEEARRHYELALTIHRELGDCRGEALVLMNLGTLLFDQGQADEARAHFERSLAIQREVGDRRAEGAVLGNLGHVQAAAGRLDEARVAFAEGERLLRETGDKLSLGMLLCSRGTMHARAGELDDARACRDVATSLAAELGVSADSELGGMLGEIGDALRIAVSAGRR